MLPEYRTIYQGGEDEIVEKKSRFIATVIPVENEEEALEFIEKTKKKYKLTDNPKKEKTRFGLVGRKVYRKVFLTFDLIILTQFS